MQQGRKSPCQNGHLTLNFAPADKKTGTSPPLLAILHGMETAALTAKPLMPQNIEAEQALLGAILSNNRSFEKVGEYLRAEHFADPVHGRIYAAIERLIERGQLANAVTLKQFFLQDEGLKAAGGAEYLARLEASVASFTNVGDYGQAIFENFLRRELIEIGTDVVTSATSPDIESSATKQIEETEQKLFNLATKGVASGGFISFNDSLKLAIETAENAARRGGGMTGITTGFKDMNKLLGGLHPSDLIILAARPSMGKTAFATNMAFNAARAYLRSAGKEGGRVAFFSLEMSAEQLALRILSEQTSIPSEKIRKGEIRDTDFPNSFSFRKSCNACPCISTKRPACRLWACAPAPAASSAPRPRPDRHRLPPVDDRIFQQAQRGQPRARSL
jgi:replicative DNA helicase